MKNYQSIKLKGFDKYGEPEIRILPDGVLYLVIELVPPCWTMSAYEEEEFFDKFYYKLCTATGLSEKEILWEDREFFRIENPKTDTIEKIRDFIENYQKTRTDYEIHIENTKIAKTIYFGHHHNLWNEISILLSGSKSFDYEILKGTRNTFCTYIRPENYYHFIQELIDTNFISQEIEDFLRNDNNYLEYLGGIEDGYGTQRPPEKGIYK